MEIDEKKKELMKRIEEKFEEQRIGDSNDVLWMKTMMKSHLGLINLWLNDLFEDFEREENFTDELICWMNEW